MRQGGNMPCVMNAANEIAVAKFLKDEIGFLQIADVVSSTMEKVPFISNPTLDDYLASDTEARRIASES
jgi:1-deoxy-D-xylulose-5-phosphate reductoisomerase